MTHSPHDNPTPNPRDPEPTREDVIIGRIVDGEASPSDWQDMDRLAERDAGVWQRLAQAQRAHARLERAVEDQIAVSELVELPLHEHRPVYEFVSRVRAYGGWAVAAVFALALIGNFNLGGVGPTPMQAGLVPISKATPDQAYDRYVQAGMADGRVVSVMPALLVDAQGLQTDDGGDVVIVRRILERVNVRDVPVYTVESNEFGQPTYTQVLIRRPEKESTPVGF